jgi:hypothetical protein
MKKSTFTTIAASLLAALSIGLAAPAIAAPSGPNPDPGQTTGSNAGTWWTNAGQTPYGTYQNTHGRHDGANR